MPNHLVNETSPYLKQHQDNPVNWYPWGDEALSLAKSENKPIFLSIGYAACHWCHVMAHESFEDEEIAKILNDKFISIKVDREERPDLDEIYMQAVVMLAGQGGWPMSVFLTPALKPFYGGTYFPPTAKFGMPSFKQVLLSVIEVWQNQQSAIEKNTKAITDAIQAQYAVDDQETQILDLNEVVNILHQRYDWHNGGWNNAPKFPQPMVIEFLIQRALDGNKKAAKMSTHLLDVMSRGGMYDLVGGGFHRYSTDPKWLVPHFEKMLYDNAQLALAYLHGYAVSRNPIFRHITIETLAFIQQEMTSPQGGFYASLDADTPEGEGRYYTWHYETLKDILSSDEFELLRKVADIHENGNFEARLIILQYQHSLDAIADEMGLSILQLIEQLQLINNKLRSFRSQRTGPNRDEKIITSWNALVIKAFAQAGRLLGREDLLSSARKAANFILKELQTEDGKLARSWNEGKASQPGTLADYASMILALHAIYEVDFDPEIFQKINILNQRMQEEFSSENALYYDSAKGVSNLIVRPKKLQDNAVPSGNALAGHVHWLFANYQEDQSEKQHIDLMLRSVTSKAQQFPTSFGYWLILADLNQQSSTQVVLTSQGDHRSLKPFLDVYNSQYRPHSVLSAKFSRQLEESVPAILHHREPLGGQPTAYVCRNFTCQQPAADPEIFKSQLDRDNL